MLAERLHHCYLSDHEHVYACGRRPESMRSALAAARTAVLLQGARYQRWLQVDHGRIHQELACRTTAHYI
jgi:hypothetical protein